MHIRIAYLVLLVLAALSSAASTLDTRQLDAYFDVLNAHQRMRGGVAIARNGSLLYRRAVGLRTEKATADLNTMYRVGSIAKVFTAVLIYQLIDEKKLTLDTKLSAFYPMLPNADRITIGHLLSHSSGLGSYNPSPSDAWFGQPQAKAQLLERFMSRKPEYEPGEKSTYSNTGFVVLGWIVEDVTRSTYAAQLERRIVKPLGLKRTRYGGEINTARNEARSFTYDDGRWSIHPEEHLSAAGASGGMVSTPADLAIFISAVFSNRLISAASVKEMVTPFAEKLPGSEKGIVVFRLNESNRTAYQHLGGIDAFNSSLTYLLDERVAIAIVFNGQNYPMGKLLYSLIDAAAGRAPALPSFAPTELPAETLSRYEGTYSFPDIGMTITIGRDGKQLTAQASGQDVFPIHAITETTFSHPPSGILIEFRPDASQFTLFQGRTQMRFRRP